MIVHGFYFGFMVALELGYSMHIDNKLNPLGSTECHMGVWFGLDWSLVMLCLGFAAMWAMRVHSTSFSGGVT